MVAVVVVVVVVVEAKVVVGRRRWWRVRRNRNALPKIPELLRNIYRLNNNNNNSNSRESGALPPRLLLFSIKK